MSDRIPVFLPLSGETVHISKRVLDEVGVSAVTMFHAVKGETGRLCAECIRGSLMAGLEALDTAEWAAMTPEKREAYLLWLLGCLDGLLIRMHFQEHGIDPETALAIAPSADDAIH